MAIEDNIERAIRHIAAKDYNNPKTDSEIQAIRDNVISIYKSQSYDFSNYCSLLLKQGTKKRSVKYYNDIYSAENVLCQCVKQILDKTFNIKYPNRNKTMKRLFSYMAAIIQMSHFTIVKFDFKDYYNSVSAPYVFEKCIKESIKRRDEYSLIKKFCYTTEYAYAGLCTSNAISEIIAKSFDEALIKELSLHGLLFYERYIDDGILILNEFVEYDEIKRILDKVLQNNYFAISENNIRKCKTKFNNDKLKYISSESLTFSSSTIDYLGYEFFVFLNKKNEINIKYGITEEKMRKYTKRVNRMISLYKTPLTTDYNDLELLRQRIMAFTSREVYISKYYKSNVWKVKGFISNYNELRYFIDTPLLEEQTKEFLKNIIIDCFNNNGVPQPYFLKTNGYNLLENLRNNKTLLLVDTIGYDYKSLSALCARIGINSFDTNGKKRGYGTLVREYLIKVKVGY